MSSFTPLLIAPFTHGLQTDLQPWIAPKDSFPVLTNFHVEHGFLERRNGYLQFGDDLTNGTAVTGIEQYIETSTGAKTLIVWDTQSAYTYSGVTQTFSQLTPANILNSGTTDYIWAANWQSTSTNGSSAVNRLYFTDGNPWNSMADPNSTGGIRYFDGGTSTTLLDPTASGFTSLPYGAKFIFAIGGRLVFLYTYETGSLTRYPQRARWCAKQNPGQNGWDDSVAGGGDFADAATSDQIISAQLLQNQIIALFTDSVWALIPTADPAKAFRWQKINNFRAGGGRKASVQYDRYVIGIGDRGITATDGSNTTRVDDGISDYVNNEISQNSFNQTFCGRDYANKRWWSLYTSTSSENNDRALIYDDDSGSYSTYEISLNCLGYGSSGYDYTWDQFTAANGFASPAGGDIQWKDFNNDQQFDSYYFQKSTNLFLGGSYDGKVYQLESNNYDLTSAISAEFLSAAWNPFNEEGVECQMSFIDFFVETSPTTTGTVSFYKDTYANPYVTKEMDFLPDLGFIASIDNVLALNPALVTTKTEHGLSDGDKIYIYLVTGAEEINSTNFAAYFTVTVSDEFTFEIDEDGSAFSAYTGGGGVYKREFYRTKTWKRVYGGGIGFWHQVGFNSSGLNETYRIHAMKPYFRKIGTRTIN